MPAAWQAQDAGEILGIGVGAVGLDHALHDAVEVLGADRMLGIDEPVVWSLEKTSPLASMPVEVSTTRDGGSSKAGGGAAVSHSWKIARMTSTFLASRRLPFMRWTADEDAPALGLLLAQPFQLVIDRAVPMVDPRPLAGLEAGLGASLVVVARRRTRIDRDRGRGGRESDRLYRRRR